MREAIFKAYDIRGVYPEEINEGIAGEIGIALARFFGKGKIIVGHDARLSSPSLYQSVNKALERNKKIKAVKISLCTTPMFYFLVNHLKAAGGIMITASHNPKEYNGLKVVRKRAIPMSGREVYNTLPTIVGYVL